MIKVGTEQVFLKSFLLFSLLLLFNSCVDKNNYKFNFETTREIYEKTFPVKDIDSDQSWKTTSIVKLNVAVYEDELESYKIKVYDRMPDNPDSPANRLAMGTVENGKTLELSFDCPLAIDTIGVNRVDKANRRIGQYVALSNKNSVTDVVFGEQPSRSRSYTENNGFSINTHEAPYSSSQISQMLSTALEVESGKAIGASYGILSNTNVYKLTKNGDSYKFVYDYSQYNNVLIVTTDWRPSEPVYVNNNNLTIVIANSGSFEGKMQITNGSTICVLSNGSIRGSNTDITITNASNSHLNYNAGTIDINSITITSGNGEFYNSGTLKLKKYSSSNENTTLTNMGQCEIDEVDTNNSNIENGCYMKINGDCSATNVIVGNSAVLECNSLNTKQWGSMKLLIGASSMVKCEEGMNANLYIQGASNGKSLVRAGKLNSTYMDDRHYYFNTAFECDDANSRSEIAKRCKKKAYVSKVGESGILIPNGPCTGGGNTPGVGGDTDDEPSSTYTCCYEDYYPIPGDYDFNDIVMDISYKATRNSSNQIVSVEIPIQLTAVGARYSIGAALQLVGIDKNNIQSVNVANSKTGVGNIFGSYEEETAANQYPVIPLFNDAHYTIANTTQRYMINTSVGREGYADATPYKMVVNITFKSPISQFSIDNLDLFIARGLVNGYYEGQKGKTRIEIHLYEFWGNLTTKSVEFAANEAAAGNRTWAICVPNFRYPYEQVPIYRISGTDTGSSINCAYPMFQQWASSHTQAQDWYLYPNSGTTYR